MVEWGRYQEAYKAIHDKLDEILTKLDYPTDPAIQDVIDRADRLLGHVYGSQGQQLKQRAGTYELMVQLVHEGTEYQAGGGAGGLVQCQIRNVANDAWINEPFARRIQGSQGQDLLQRATTYDLIVQLRNAGVEIDPRDRNWTITEALARSWNLGSSDVPDLMDRTGRLLGIIYGDVGQLLQRPTTRDLLVQLRNAGSEIDPRQIRPLTSSDVVFVEQTDPTKLKSTVTQAAKDRYITDVTKVVTQKKIDLTATGVIHTPVSGKKIRIKAFAWSSNADIVTALRFGTAGDLLFPIQAKGVIGMNLVGCNIEGATDEALYGYLSGTGTMKGTVLMEEV